ncbi:MAG TPA: 4Fe-4S dicluster domain-containing protein [Fimbriimonas sp.]
MSLKPWASGSVLERRDFALLLTVLQEEGYRTIGPTVRDGAIVFAEIAGEADLPSGRTARAEPGSYRLEEVSQPRLFAYPPPPNGAKPFLFHPRRHLWSAQQSGLSVRVEPTAPDATPTALIGLRACDLRAIEIQDRVFLQSGAVDVGYQAAREAAFLVGVNCGGSAPTCFCASVGSGPVVTAAHDLCLTELLDENGHRFLLSAGTEKGARILGRLPTRPAVDLDLGAAEAAAANANRMQTRRLQTEGLKERLYAHAEHSRWSEVAQRCLACGNCTSVCPTCFCSTVEDKSDLSGSRTDRVRLWDSCFNTEFSYIHGGSVRSSVMSRYRQWLTHKLAAWQDQFGSLGCVGCGRCIAWCPAGIDMVEEANAVGRAAIDRAAVEPPGPASLVAAAEAFSQR